MNQKILALVGVGVASVIAASGGAFLALREPVQPAQRVSTEDTLSDRPIDGAARESVAGSATTAGKVVNETEGVITPEPTSTPGAVASQPDRQRSSAKNDQAPPKASASSRTPATERAAKPSFGRPTGSAKTSTGREAATAATIEAQPRVPAGPTADRDLGSVGTTIREPVTSPAPVPAEAEAPQVAVSEPLPSRPSQPEFTDVTVPAESVIGLQVDRAISSEQARVEDLVEARVTRDVRAGGRVAFPAGSRMLGSVVMVEKGGKVRERARLGIRFHTLVLADGTRVPVQTDTIYREGSSPAGESAAKMGGAAVGGAILGAILGGGRGAAIGGSIGAAAGTAAVLASDRNPATLPAGSTVTVRLQSPATFTVER